MGENPEHPVPERPARFTRRNFLLGTSALAVGLPLYAGEIARHEVSVTTRTIGIRNLPEAFRSFRIVQITDIHFDEFTEPSFLRRIVKHVNGIGADMVLLTGDFISEGPRDRTFAQQAVYRCAEILAGLTCPLRFACIGNHDMSVGQSYVVDALSRVPIPVLINRSIPIERGGHHLWLAGVSDPAAGDPNLHLAIPQQADAPLILMCHGPDYADNVVAHPRGHNVDFMLSGHSHGGQIRLPFIGATILPPWGQKYVEGYFRIGHLQLYVNRGIGTVGLPLRLNCPPEIAIFILQPSASI